MPNDPCCLTRPPQMSLALHQPQVKVLVHNHAPLPYPQPTPRTHMGMPPMYPQPPGGKPPVPHPGVAVPNSSGHASSTVQQPNVDKAQESKQYLNLDMQQHSYRYVARKSY